MPKKRFVVEIDEPAVYRVVDPAGTIMNECGRKSVTADDLKKHLAIGLRLGFDGYYRKSLQGIITVTDMSESEVRGSNWR